MPNRPLKSAARLGRQGASDVWQLANRRDSAASLSMLGDVSRQ